MITSRGRPRNVLRKPKSHCSGVTSHKRTINGNRLKLMGKSWVVYVLLSDSNRRTYVGVTLDLYRRILQHNGLLIGGARATRSGRPWQIGKTYGPYPSRSVALRIESKVKRLPGRLRLEWLERDF